MSQLTADVVVVGGGPVGLAAALHLADRGWSAVLVERWPAPYGRPRAVSLDGEAVRTLQDLGVWADFEPLTDSRDFYRWVNGDGETLLEFDDRTPGRAGFRSIKVSQPELEALLEARAAAHPLVTILRGVEAVAREEDDDGVTVALRSTGSGVDAGSVRGRYVIGADGANSVVRGWIGTEMTDLGFFHDWLVVDLRPRTALDWDHVDVQWCDPRRPVTHIGAGPGRMRLEFMVLPGERAEDVDSEARVWELAAPFGYTPATAELERHTVYRFQARWAAVWNRDRLVLAGDAAHQMPPFAGQGLSSGFREVANLAWKLDLVLAGRAPGVLLDTYTRERTEHVRAAVAFSLELGRVICVLDPAAAAERDARMTAAGGDPHQVLPTMPPATFTGGVVRRVGGRTQEAAGTVAPQLRVRSLAGEGLFDDVATAGAALVLAPGAGGGPTAVAAASFEDLGGAVFRLAPRGEPAPGVLVDVDGAYAAELAGLGAVAALWRPDGYYFGVATSAADVDALVADFVAAVRVAEPETAARP